MPIEKLFKIEALIFRATMEKYGVTRHDLKILSCCRNSEESLYSLEMNHGLDRGLTMKRLRFLEVEGFITREPKGRKKVVVPTERSRELIEFLENIKI